ncbi:elongation factor 1-delta-like isoform X2 [Antennarius striatus]|uniref:elongation factor 1-delta-like isoform X2 n=2 Tax=Antennarius striatus TaxID=241820 RepID=UPI0035B08117
MSQPLPNSQQGEAAAVGSDRHIDIPIEGCNISGEKDQHGKLRQHASLSQSESHSSGQEEECMSFSVEGSGSYGQSPILQGMQAEGDSHQRSPFEHAESNYQRWLASSSRQLSSSPRSPNTRGFFSFQYSPRHTRGQQHNQGQPITIVKASGTHQRHSMRGRNRTTSETERWTRGSREPVQRKRGFSETESRPMWDNNNMSGLQCLASEKIWFDKHRYDEAEMHFYAKTDGPIAKHQQSSSHARGDQELAAQMKSLELENQTLRKVVEDMRAALQKLESRVAVLEKSPAAAAAAPCAKTVPAQSAPVKKVEDEDDDFDLFGSEDEEDEETSRLKEERLNAYAAKKAKKPTVIAKSSILLDVKPWDDETDMAKVEECVRSVQMDGLLWGASKLVPVGYGIKKLQISCVVEDEKVGTDILEEEITKFEDYVQSVDVAAFNKI